MWFCRGRTVAQGGRVGAREDAWVDTCEGRQRETSGNSPGGCPLPCSDVTAIVAQAAAASHSRTASHKLPRPHLWHHVVLAVRGGDGERLLAVAHNHNLKGRGAEGGTRRPNKACVRGGGGGGGGHPATNRMSALPRCAGRHACPALLHTLQVAHQRRVHAQRLADVEVQLVHAAGGEKGNDAAAARAVKAAEVGQLGHAPCPAEAGGAHAAPGGSQQARCMI